MYTINGNAMSLDRDGNMLMHSGPKSVARSVRDHKYISKTYKNGKWVYKYERPIGKSSRVRVTAGSIVRGLQDPKTALFNYILDKLMSKKKKK